MAERTIQTEIELQTLAQEIFSILPQKKEAHVITLSGDLGAGKTAFVKAFARELGIVEHVTSPTFVLMKHYQVPAHDYFHTLTHIDAYRVEDEDEVRILDLPKLYRDTGRLICIEWPERIPKLLPQDAVEIHIAIMDGDTRTIIYNSYGDA